MPPKKKRTTAAGAKRSRLATAQEHFVEGLVTRGQAASKKSAGQELPPGATHWIVEDKKTGKTTVKRARFSLVPKT